MRKFYTLAGILSVSEEEKESIRQQALEGDPVACYKLAEIHLHLHECEDYVASAQELLQKASEGGVADAEAMDLCMINGARLHNASLLVATVEAYRHGRLTRFAREIEMFHIPAYDAIPDDEPLDEDEDIDDDGRFDAWA